MVPFSGPPLPPIPMALVLRCSACIQLVMQESKEKNNRYIRMAVSDSPLYVSVLVRRQRCLSSWSFRLASLFAEFLQNDANDYSFVAKLSSYVPAYILLAMLCARKQNL